MSRTNFTCLPSRSLLKIKGRIRPDITLSVKALVGSIDVALTYFLFIHYFHGAKGISMEPRVRGVMKELKVEILGYLFLPSIIFRILIAKYYNRGF